MRNLLKKAISYSPEIVLDFIMATWEEINLDGKNVFQKNLINYFLADELSYEDDIEPEYKYTNKNK